MTVTRPSRRALVLTGVPAALLLLAACGGRDAKDRTATPSPTASSTGSAGSDGLLEGRDIDRAKPYLELATGADGPTVDLLLDFRCPPCRYFMEQFGDYFQELVTQKKAVLRIHPRPMLDERRGSTYSQDTASAAAAVYAQDPALLLPFEKAMYAAQAPSGDDPDPTLEKIAEIARGVGADDKAVDQILGRAFVPWTLEVVEPAAVALQVGTPTVVVDGKVWEGDWTVEGELRKAIGA